MKSVDVESFPKKLQTEPEGKTLPDEFKTGREK
jgi:hypothetical protein